MVWHNQGTATVANGSAVVTIAGGDLISAGVAAGQGFQVYRASELQYDIASVDSATQLTLSRNYIGTGDSGLSFDIVPVLGPQREAETSLRSLLAIFEAAQTGALAGVHTDGLSVSDEGNTLLTLSDAGNVLNGLLGGSAVMSTTFDQTVGRLMTVGALGMFGNPKTLTSANNLDTEYLTGLYYSGSGDPVQNDPGAGSYMILVMQYGSDDCVQVAFRLSGVTYAVFYRAVQNAETGKAWASLDLTTS
jgi:hypothetical protein